MVRQAHHRRATGFRFSSIPARQLLPWIMSQCATAEDGSTPRARSGLAALPISSSPQAGDWVSVQFNSGAATSTLDNVTMRYGGGWFNASGAVRISGSSDLKLTTGGRLGFGSVQFRRGNFYLG